MVLSKMQIIKYIFGIVILNFCVVNFTFAQDWQNAFNSYLTGKFDEGMLQNTNQAIIVDPYYITLTALNKKNAEEAFQLYQKALKYVENAELKKFINDKIADYYYASGLYLTANKYRAKQNTESENINIQKTETILKANIYLQFGVFSSKENANNYISNNQQRDLQLKILEATGKFYIVSGPYFSEAEARLMKLDVRSQYKKLKPFIKRF
ncbi:MAG: SPOR domain-containing protein [Calditrichia bacterium]|nr:SPOR domain-containing protein [Calditrichia bacterium]